MEQLYNYNEDGYYLLEGYEQDYYYFLEDYTYPEQGAAAAAGGGLYEGAQSLGDSENQQGNLNQGGHVDPANNVGPEGAQRFQQPRVLNPQEPVLPGPEVPRPQPRRRQTRFRFAQWQVEEMEAVFQVTQYPDELTRYVASRGVTSCLPGLDSFWPLSSPLSHR